MTRALVFVFFGVPLEIVFEFTAVVIRVDILRKVLRVKLFEDVLVGDFASILNR